MKQRPAPKLLIVEDVKSTRMLVKSVLGKEGYQVFDAANGLQGVETFEREHPDVILMDVMMPVMNGFDACRRIRALDSGKDTPIIMLTGAEDIEAIETAFDAGATDFITKPISWPLLTQRLRYAMRGAELMREVRQNRIREAAAQRIAKVAFWGWHPATDGFMHSDDLPRMLDLGVEQLPSLHSLLAIVAESDRERARRAFTVAESSSTRIDLEVRTLATDGERIIRIIGERGAEGRDLGHFFGAIHDISETRRTEALIDYLALHDELTGLGNRRMFSQTLHKRLTEFTSRDEGYRLLIGWIDLHRFHRLNDELGETAGDAVLKQIADRLRAHGEDVTVARVGGDEFAVLLEAAPGEDPLTDFDRVIGGLRNAFRIQDKEIFLNCSAGVALAPEHGADTEQLLTLAQEAQRLARAQSRTILVAPQGGQGRSNSLAIEQALRRALKQREFELFYQPQMNLRSGCIIGAEALLRWRDPSRGLISPAEFIPVLEESGQIVEVGEWVIEEACRQARTWERAGKPLRIGINLSPLQFMDESLRDKILRTVSRTGVSTSNIELEITESLAMQEPERAVELLRLLRQDGFKIAIDDFGIGYSSLEYLLRFPLDTIKIDRAFVTHIITAQADRAIVRAITAIAQTLGTSTIAEGVENMRQCDFIEALGVAEIQGFLIGRPMPRDDFERFLETFVRPGA